MSLGNILKKQIDSNVWIIDMLTLVYTICIYSPIFKKLEYPWINIFILKNHILYKIGI